VKVTGHGADDEYLQNEFDVLGMIYNKSSNSMRTTIPKPLLFTQFQRNNVYFQTAIIGKSLMRPVTLRVPNPWRQSLLWKRLSSTLDWLVKFHQEFTEDTILVGQILRDWVEPAFRTYQNQQGISRSVNSLFELVVHTCENNAMLGLPSTCEHGDYYDRNVLFQRDGIGVIDWEHAVTGKFPYLDIFIMPLALLMLDVRQYGESSVFPLYNTHNPYQRVAAMYIDGYFNMMKIPKQLSDVFLTLTIVHVVNRFSALDDQSSMGQARRFQLLLDLLASHISDAEAFGI